MAETQVRTPNRFWMGVRRVAASDRLSGLIMLGFALAGLILANLPVTAHLFETIAETHIAIPRTNIDLPIGHWAQDGLLTVFFLMVGLDLKQELTTGSLANPKAAAVPMLCAVGGMMIPPVLFLAVRLCSRVSRPPGLVWKPSRPAKCTRIRPSPKGGRSQRPRTSHSPWQYWPCSPRHCPVRSVHSS